MLNDTIFAILTPYGRSALAVIRVSGPSASNIKEKIFKPKKLLQKHFIATHGNLLEMDDAICISYPSIKSYTGELTFELFIHGNPIIAERTMEIIQSLGARIALPGEFTTRAFLHGKIDLTQAEAVCDLINARSEASAQIALRNLNGDLLKCFEIISKVLVKVIAQIEAQFELSEEGGFENNFSVIYHLNKSIKLLEYLLNNFTFANTLTNGVRIVLFGRPNVGKSSLFNKLLKNNRSIVHNEPGTTRDIIEANWELNGIPITLIDVAGIRTSIDRDSVERIGIQKAQLEAESADLILHLQEPTQQKLNISGFNTAIIDVFTKADIRNPSYGVSAKTGLGISELCSVIFEFLTRGGNISTRLMLTKLRQKKEVIILYKYLLSIKQHCILNTAGEIILFELRAALDSLGKLTGRNYNKQILNEIFKKFCIGK